MNSRSPPLLLDSRRALAVLLLVLAGAGRCWPPELTASEPTRPTSMSAQDLRLTLDARRLLASDAKLSGLNLGVQVRGGVATVYGPVTSAEVMDRAREALKPLKGIREVRNELTVLAPEDMPRAESKPQRPSPEPSTLPVRVPHISATLPAKEPEPLAGPVLEAQPAETLLPPVLPVLPVEEKKPPVLPPASPGLRATIEQMRQAEPRFPGIVFEVSGNVVYLRGTGPEVKAFAQVVALVPGVERVALVGPSP